MADKDKPLTREERIAADEQVYREYYLDPPTPVEELDDGASTCQIEITKVDENGKQSLKDD